MKILEPRPRRPAKHQAEMNIQSTIPGPRYPTNPTPPKSPEVTVSSLNPLSAPFNMSTANSLTFAQPQRKVYHSTSRQSVSAVQPRDTWHTDDTTTSTSVYRLFDKDSHPESLAGKSLEAFRGEYNPDSFPRPDNPMIFFELKIPAYLDPKFLEPLETKFYTPPPYISPEERNNIDFHVAATRFLQNEDNAKTTLKMLEMAKRYAEEVCMWWFRMILYQADYRTFGPGYNDKAPVVLEGFSKQTLREVAQKGLWEYVLYCPNLGTLLKDLSWSEQGPPKETIDTVTIRLEYLAMIVGRFRSSNRQLMFQACEALKAEMKEWVSESPSWSGLAQHPWQPIPTLTKMVEFCKLLKDFRSPDNWCEAFQDIIELHTKLTVDQIARGVELPILHKSKPATSIQRAELLKFIH